MKCKNEKKPYLCLWIITSVMFCMLFGRFIFGEYGYTYTDIGSDTFKINYSLFQLFSDVFHGKVQGSYLLNVGMGADMSSYLYQYLNPLNFFIVMLPKHLLPWALLAVTYVKLVVISLAGYHFFQKILHDQTGSFVAAFVWTFSSYVMVWGQHYGFCTSLMMFTVFLNLVYAHGEDVEKSHNKIMVLWITLMLFTNYYFLYMSGIAAAVFLIVYLSWKKESWKKIGKKVLELAGMGILGVMMGGTCLVSTMTALGNSARAGEVNFSGLGTMLLPYDKSLVISNLGRFFSNHIFGVANDYQGAMNYYEVAMLFTSALFLLALWYLLWQKKYRFRTMTLALLSIWMIISPFSGKILNMNPFSQRWTFLICFLEAFAIGLFIREILKDHQEKSIKNQFGWMIFSPVVLFGITYAILSWADGEEIVKFHAGYFYVYVGFFALYACLFFLYNYIEKIKNIAPVLLVGILCVELFVTNRPGFELRENPTRNQLAVDQYNDGTREALHQIGDQEVYRVAKTFHSGSENDSIAQGYSGLSVYMTTNQQDLIQLRDTYGGTGISNNFAAFDNENYIRNSLFGMKYFIAKDGEGISKRNYTPVQNYHGNTIYYNENALPFGYFYDRVWEKEEIMELSEIERTLAAVEGFFYTEETSDTSDYEKALTRERSEVSLMDLEMEGNNCVVEKNEEGIYLSQFGPDPHIVIPQVGMYRGDGNLQLLTVEYELQESAKELAVYYMLEGDEGYRGDQVFTFDLEEGKRSWTGFLPADVTQLRLDPGENQSELKICDIRIDHCESSNLAYKKLKEATVTNTRFYNDCYEAEIKNLTQEVKMMCIPIVYHKGWKAFVDEKETKLYNINNGLCGVEIPSGATKVMLKYEEPGRRIGFGITGIGVVSYLIWIFISFSQKRKKQV